MRIVVIGSGFGGLAAAVRLQARGHEVTVIEKRDKPGGRAYMYEQDGFTFDGGSFMTTLYFYGLYGAAWNKSCVVRPAYVVTSVRLSAPGRHPAGGWPPPRANTRLSREETAPMRWSTGPLIAALVAIGLDVVSASPAPPLHRRRERAW
jgi:phytoene dehydrogenase-like protein